ncbi:MAG: cadmium-translocating P-type ATPase [Firmicutes bacterium]|nr:cadmium-translocating P-type ATPase [Bacillota bacterium]
MNNRDTILQILAGALLFAAALFSGGTGRLLLFLAAYAVLGWKVYYHAFRGLLKGRFLNESFLMCAATVGALSLGEYPEAVAVMLFYLVGDFFEDLAVHRSKKSIAGLMDIRPDYANVATNGGISRVNPESVKIGDVIVVKPGEKIPLDGIVRSGESALDTRALTGESAPRGVGPSDAALSGCVNLSGVLRVEVTKTFGESTASRIIALVESAGSRKAPTENFITVFARYYTPAVVGLAALLAVLPPVLFGEEWAGWIHRALVFLMVSCPCALVISVPLAFFGGIGRASRNGILIKGGNYLEALNHLDIVVFDKTGTLTEGVFEVAGLYPAAGFTEENLLETAALAEAFSDHPIAQSIRRAYGKGVGSGGVSDFRETAGQGVRAAAGGRRVLAGSAAMMKAENVPFTENGLPGTKVYIAENRRFAGSIIISDQIKPDSRAAVAGLREAGVRLMVMLSGDEEEAARAVADELALDAVFARLLPHEKVEKIELLERSGKPGGKLAFVGDGINDAPVLARADVGVAMGGFGSDAAIEAADVVLMTDEPSKLAEAVKIAKATRRVALQNIVFALGVKGVFLVLGALGMAGMWEAVFADTGVAVLAILNSMRIIIKR